MKIWFDVLTPKQVMFFKPMIDLLVGKSGHQVLCTSRDYREAVELAKIKNLDIKIIGKHGGSDRYDKLVESSKRTLKLSMEVNSFGPDVAVTFSSPEGARVAYGLGIKHVGFNDSPHAEAVARLTVPLMDRLLCPWVIPTASWTRFGISKEKVIKYRALDPVVWLRHDISHLQKYGDAEQILEGIRGSKSADIDRSKKTILIRLEETKASYIADKKLAKRADMIDALVKRLWQSTNIIILCRYKDQVSQVADQYRGMAHVPANVIDSIPLIAAVDLFVGAGGTMTAEAALIGKPTVSIAPISFDVEKYLVNSGLVEKARDSKSLIHIAERMIDGKKYQESQKSRAKRVLDSMEDPIAKVMPIIENAAK